MSPFGWLVVVVRVRYIIGSLNTCVQNASFIFVAASSYVLTLRMYSDHTERGCFLRDSFMLSQVYFVSKVPINNR